MKLKSIALTLLTLAPLAQASVTVDLPSDINLLIVNEKEATEKNINNDGYLELNNGLNQIVFDFRRVIKPGSSQSEHFESSPIVVTFEASDKKLDLQLPSMLTMNDYTSFEKNPNIKLVSSDSVEQEYKIDKLNKALVSLLANYEKATSDFNNENNIKLSNNTIATNQRKSEQKPIKNNEQMNLEISLDSLKDDFNQLPHSKKQEFLSWAVSNL